MKVLIKHRGSNPHWTGNWIEYWKEHSGKRVPTNCPCCGSQMITNGGAVGAHVVKVSCPKGEVFITPTCDICNKTYKESKTNDHTFLVDEDMLVPANEKRLEESETQNDDDVDDDLLRLANLNRNDLK